MHAENGRSGGGGAAALLGLIADGASSIRRSSSLRRSLALWSVAGLVATLGAVAGLMALHGALVAWLLPAAVAWWLLVIVFLAGGVPLLVTPAGERIEYYGVPNGLTALRAWLCLPLFVDAFLPLPGSLSLILWCSVGFAAGMLDFVDGWIARRVGPITTLGKAIDPAMDSFFFAMSAVGNVQEGIIPWWVSAVLLLRFLGPFAATPLVFLARRRPELVHTSWGRRNTALVGVLLFTCMCIRILGGPTAPVATVITVVAVAPTMLLHFAALWRRTAQAPVVA